MFLERHNKKSLQYRIVNDDEKWIHYDNPTQRKAKVIPGEPSTLASKWDIRRKKLTL